MKEYSIVMLSYIKLLHFLFDFPSFYGDDRRGVRLIAIIDNICFSISSTGRVCSTYGIHVVVYCTVHVSISDLIMSA